MYRSMKQLFSADEMRQWEATLRDCQREKTQYSWITHDVFKLLIWSDSLCGFIYSSNLRAVGYLINV